MLTLTADASLTERTGRPTEARPLVTLKHKATSFPGSAPSLAGHGLLAASHNPLPPGLRGSGAPRPRPHSLQTLQPFPKGRASHSAHMWPPAPRTGHGSVSRPEAATSRSGPLWFGGVRMTLGQFWTMAGDKKHDNSLRAVAVNLWRRRGSPRALIWDPRPPRKPEHRAAGAAVCRPPARNTAFD